MIKITLNDKMTNLADAIRGKTGITSPLTLDTMASEIESINVGEDIETHNAQINTHNALMNRTTAITEADSNFDTIMIRGIYAGTVDMEDGVSDLPSGVIYLKIKEVSSVNLINFTISGVTYQAEEGMTWAEWVNSSYNTGGFYIYSNTVRDTRSHTVIIDGYGFSADTTVIKVGEDYSTADY